MKSRIGILKRSQTRETKEAATNDRATEMVANAEIVAHVKNCIGEFQAPRHARTSSHAVRADTA